MEGGSGEEPQNKVAKTLNCQMVSQLIEVKKQLHVSHKADIKLIANLTDQLWQFMKLYYSWISVCAGEMEIFKNHPSTYTCLTRPRN